MKILLVFIVGTAISWTTMVWSMSLEETNIINNGDYVIIFLNKADASEYMKDADFYNRMNDYMDASIRLEEDLSSNEPEKNDELIRSHALNQTMNWTNKEINRVSNIVIETQNKIKHNYSSILSDTLYLIKTSGDEEFDAYYTIKNAIIVPKKETKFLWIKPRKEELIGLYAHELLHIFTRNNPEKRRFLYDVIGFEEVETLQLPKDLKNRLITNPDLHGNYIAIELQDSLGQSNLYTLLITSKYDTYEGKKGIIGRINTLLGYIELGLYKIDSEGVVSSERNNLNDNFFDKIGRISGYHYGADEVIAEAFRVLIEIQDEQIDNHPNFEKIKKQRNRDILKSISKILSQARS